MRCPCRKKSETRSYEDCCQPYHAGMRGAPTPEALMRSRYAAFALGDARYLSTTWHPSTRPPRIEIEPSLEWLQLRVLAAQANGEEGTVEFIASSRAVGQQTQRLHEVSRFVREDGRWLYVGGDIR